MDEQELQEFTLEDILKEFGDQPEDVSEEIQEETPEVVEQGPAKPIAEPVAEPMVTGDTIRLDAIRLP